MKKKSWKLELDGQEHTVELEHGVVFGKRKIYVDGQLVEESRKLFDTGSDHTFQIGAHLCTVHIRTNGLTFNYDLSVDGYPVGMKGAVTPSAPGSAARSAFSYRLLELENRFKGGANWFYWIAGLSLLNSLIFLFGGNMSFVVGLGITQVVDGIVSVIANEFGGTVATVAHLLGMGGNVLITAIFVVFGVLARKKHRWAFIVGMVLYALDILILMWAKDFYSILFHAIALFGLYRGMATLKELQALMATQPAETLAGQEVLG